MPASHPPECVSIVVCDLVIEDKHTNNKTLVGLFNGIGAGQAPVRHPRMFIMASLSDGRGEHPIKVTVESPSGKHLFDAQVKVRFDDPLVVHDLVFEVLGLILPEFGEYYLGVYCGSERLGSRRFSLVKMEQADASDPGQG